MRGKLKTLGVALVATLAVSAVVASAAMATAKITASDGVYPLVLTGHQEAKAEGGGSVPGENFFESTPGNKVHCTTATYESTVAAAANATTITVTPHYAGCTATPSGGGSVNATVDLNGCDYTFSALTWTAAGDTTHGTAQVDCTDPNQTITVTIATCQIHIKPQHIGDTPHPNPTIEKPITFTNKAAGGSTLHPYVTVDVDATTVHYLETDGFLCPFSGDTTGTEGRFKSTVVLKGYADSGTHSHPTTGTPSHPVNQYTHPATDKATQLEGGRVVSPPRVHKLLASLGTKAHLDK
jgi:hypothetical protein